MAYTVTWPEELNARLKKHARERESRKNRSAAGKGPLGRVMAAVRGALAGILERPGRGEYALRKGASGEQAVAEELDRLPDGWFIVNDVRVSGRQIDHIVLGPKGIFCLETKHSGTVRIDKAGNFYRMERGMWVPANSPAVQNMRHIKSLRKFLRDRYHLQPHIRSVVVYVGQGRFELETLTVPPGRTKIAFYNNLREHLLAQPDVSWHTKPLREIAFAIAGVKLTPPSKHV